MDSLSPTNALALLNSIPYINGGSSVSEALAGKSPSFTKVLAIMSGISHSVDRIDGDTSGMVNTNVEWLQDNMNRVEYEPRKSKKAKKTEKGLDKFTK